MSMRPVDLIPTGTARQRWATSAGRGFGPALDELLAGSELDAGRAFLAWQLARLPPGLSDEQRNALSSVVARLLLAQAAGSTRLAITAADRDVLARAGDVVAPPGRRAPLILAGNHLYTERSYACEHRVASALATRMNRPSGYAPKLVARVVDDVVRSASPRLSDEQRQALAHVLARSLGVVTGGPGSGKTTLVSSVVRCLVRLGVPASGIALTAPTGKAASRLGDAIAARLSALPQTSADRDVLSSMAPAQTLHRLLGIAPRRLRRERDVLPFQAVIVDECSMIDLGLMDTLVAALPGDALLVLVGDADQLPSVSAGAVFRDLGFLAVRLGRSFRTDTSSSEGAQLAGLAASIRTGALPVSLPGAVRERAEELHHGGIEWLPAGQRDDCLRRYHQRLFRSHEVVALSQHVFTVTDGRVSLDDAAKLDALAARIDGSQILTVTQQRQTGAARTNAFLHDLGGGGPGFLPGEPILLLRNDHERELWNGDRGVAVRWRAPGGPPQDGAAFRAGNDWRIVDPRSTDGALDHGFALTVHKAQGSEYDHVLLLLPDEPFALLSRELLYTAVSRARRGLVVCGPAGVFQTGVASMENRSSGLSERLHPV